ncbi:MAG: homocysteine S-methyltransferase family protein, partial [Bacteroidaceae bacterium]|nr:homocysteine S-methyltransferase family protein [Bacteroidaceae bacterium]
MTLQQRLEQASAQGRALLFDGAMGTMIMRQHLTEEDFRGEEFCQWPVLLRGNNDLLVLTRPDVISDIHRQYLEAGADFLSTCTFSSQRVSQQEYHLADHCERMCREGVRLARAEADRMTALTPDQPRFVLGDVGPTSRMLSMSEDVNNPADRSITFDALADAFREQMQWLVDAGVDGLLVETIFDTLNAKAAIAAYNSLTQRVPLFLSVTVSDSSGRTLSGQTIPAFCATVAYAQPLCVGMNCGLGPSGMLPLIQQMRGCWPGFVSCYPNAGLPNEMGQYDVTPADMVAQMRPMMELRLVDIIGGCCGTTPEHIAAMRQLIEEFAADSTAAPRSSVMPAPTSEGLTLAGLEPFTYGSADFIVVGERCNVAGSRKFLRLINEKQYDEALAIARRQVEQGAMVIDINMDDGLLDARAEMRTFLHLLASDPAICRVPVMVDSSRFDVIEEGLKCFQGKAVVNSISLKQGEAEFLDHARRVKALGAAVIVMCFDEQGQATDYERRIAICERTYRLLTHEVGFAPSDIIFDPNVLTIATGMAEHADYARDFIRATHWITTHLPGARVSGGLSNLSFAFRGNNYLREAMHSVFLHHARKAGMGMAVGYAQKGEW